MQQRGSHIGLGCNMSEGGGALQRARLQGVKRRRKRGGERK